MNLKHLVSKHAIRHAAKQLRHLEHHLGPAAYNATHGHDGQVLFGCGVIFLVVSLFVYILGRGSRRVR